MRKESPRKPPQKRYRKSSAQRTCAPMPGRNTPLPPERRSSDGPSRTQARLQTGGGELKRPQITLKTVFNICKTATQAAKVNSVPGSSKVSEFKCFPFA